MLQKSSLSTWQFHAADNLSKPEGALLNYLRYLCFYDFCFLAVIIYFLLLLIDLWVFFYILFILFIFYLYIIDFYISWIFLFCNSAFEQGHLDTWRYKNALIIIIIILSNPAVIMFSIVSTFLCWPSFLMFC